MEQAKAVGRAGLLAVLALTVLATVSRWMETGAGLPHLVEPDNAYFLQPTLIADGRPQARNHHDYNRYPHLIARLLMLLPDRQLRDNALEEHLAQAGSPMLRPRVLIAIAGAACVPATFVLAREFLSVGWSLFAAALLSTSLLHQLFSAQGRPHVAVTLFIALTIWASIRLLRRANWSDYLVAGALAALAVGCLYNGIAALLPLGMAHWLRSRSRAKREHLKLLAPLALIAASIAAFYPFLFDAELANWTNRFTGDSLRFGAHIFHFNEIHGRGFGVIAWSLWSYDPILSCLLGLALPLFVWRSFRLREISPDLRRRTLVAASFALPYLALVGLYDSSFERFVIPLLPCLCVFAAWGLQAMVEFSPSGAPRRIIAAVLALVVLAWPAWASIKLTRLCAAPDTSTRAAEWMSTHLEPRAERILMTWQVDLPLLREPAQAPPFPPEDLRVGAWYYPWTYYQLDLAPGAVRAPTWNLGWLPNLDPAFLQELRDTGVAALQQLDWTVIVDGSFRDGWIPMNQQRCHDAFIETGERIARFAPCEVAGEARTLWWQESHRVESPFWQRLLVAHSFGPVIDIYRRR